MKKVIALMLALSFSMLAMADSGSKQETRSYLLRNIKQTEGTVAEILGHVKAYENDPTAGYPKETAKILLRMQASAMTSVFLACEGIANMNMSKLKDRCQKDVKWAISVVDEDMNYRRIDEEVGVATKHLLSEAFYKVYDFDMSGKDHHGVER